jgi:ketosteroid isomerase-like protein
MVEDKNFSGTFAATKVEVSKGGDVGYSQGTYTINMTDPKTKKAVTEHGKYVTVYKKQADGGWKAVEDINNADAPAVPAK